MARKINVKLIMELRDTGLSQSAIASTRHISRHSVSEVFNIADEKGIHYDDIRTLDDSEVYRIFYPAQSGQQSILPVPGDNPLPMPYGSVLTSYYLALTFNLTRHADNDFIILLLLTYNFPIWS